MYSEFRIQNFRGFKDLKLTNLVRVNLFAGKNNTGKTSLLEALFLYINPYNPELTIRITGFRGLREIRLPPSGLEVTLWDSLFNGFDNAKTIQFSGMFGDASPPTLHIRLLDAIKDSDLSIALPTNGGEASTALSSEAAFRTLIYDIAKTDGTRAKYQLTIGSDGSPQIKPPLPKSEYPCFYFSSTVREGFSVLAQRWSTLVMQGTDEFVLEVLQTIEPRLKKLELLQLYDQPIIHGMLDSSLRVPIIFMGDGVVRLLQLILALGNAQNGFILIDEIENGLHYSIQTDVWKAIAKAAKLFNVQVFATTHSLEMIRAAQEAFKADEKDDFRFHRLDRDSERGDIEVVPYSQKTMEAAVRLDYEVRG